MPSCSTRFAYPQPDRLIRLSGGATLPHFEAFRNAGSFSDVRAFFEPMSLSGMPPETLKGARITPRNRLC